MKVTETQGPHVKVGSIAGENAGSSKVNSGAVQHGGVSGTQGEGDEDLGVLFCGCAERGAKLVGGGTVLTQFPNRCGRQPWHGLPLFTHRQF